MDMTKYTLKMIKYIITDFDGTLFDTKQANIQAYREAFNDLGYVLNEQMYSSAFGLKFDEMCNALGVTENKAIRDKIKKKKAELYRNYAGMTSVNKQLLAFLKWQYSLGAKIAIASTARKENMMSVINYHMKAFPELGVLFSAIVTADDVTKGKPDPEVYNIAMKKLGADDHSEVLVFEDSNAGIEAASNAGIASICKINI